jgi:hypothetical protein
LTTLKISFGISGYITLFTYISLFRLLFKLLLYFSNFLIQHDHLFKAQEFLLTFHFGFHTLDNTSSDDFCQFFIFLHFFMRDIIFLVLYKLVKLFLRQVFHFFSDVKLCFFALGHSFLVTLNSRYRFDLQCSLSSSFNTEIALIYPWQWKLIIILLLLNIQYFLDFWTVPSLPLLYSLLDFSFLLSLARLQHQCLYFLVEICIIPKVNYTINTLHTHQCPIGFPSLLLVHILLGQVGLNQGVMQLIGTSL